jgi:hypothetical protein
MLCVLPVTKSDKALALKLAGLISLFGGVKQHKLLVVGTLSTVKEATAISDLLADIFEKSEVFMPETECEIGWPQSCNHLFSQVVLYLDRTQNKLPWYFCEADCTPIRATWLDEIETEYNTSKKPFLGAVQKTRLVDPETGEFSKYDGEHVIGSCVYPADFARRSTLWRYIRWDNDPPRATPWDVYIRHEVRPMTQVSKTIQSNWRTKNYRIGQGGRITCEPIDDLSVCDPISDEVAVIHGCKDGSLIDELTGGRKVK